MDTLRKHFPGMTAAEYAWLRGELLRRAALDYEQLESWHAAAGCWADLGEHGRAGDLYARGGDLGMAARALLQACRYAAALDAYRGWEYQLTTGDDYNRIKALFGQAACHLLGAGQKKADGRLSLPAGREAYRRGRALVEAEAGRDERTAARCWAALGEYGEAVNRYDLVQEGYEQALVCIGDTRSRREGVEICRAYLGSVRARGDYLLTRALEERLAAWDLSAEGPEDHEQDRLRKLKRDELLVASARTGNAEIFVIDLRTGNARNLSKNQSHNCYPAWAPDGQTIAFVSTRDGNWNIYTMDADGDNVNRLTEARAFDLSPSWSPDGKLITFYRRIGDRATLMLMDADGANPRALTDDGWDPAWSPDGKMIAFTSARSSRGYHVYVMNADGTNLQELTRNHNRFGFVHPAWSPDGRKIAYTDQAGNALEIFVCDADGTNVEQLTTLGGLNTFATWSPDGKQIALHHRVEISRPSGSCYLLTVDGLDPPQMIEILKDDLPVEGGRVAWRPR
jgi:hypothetical protein